MQQDHPDIIVFPPLAFFIALLVPLALWKWLPIGGLPAYPWVAGIIIGLIVIAAALVINISGFMAFRRETTNVDPRKPALKVVRSGVFRITRNPMYLGMVLLITGLGFALSNLWGLIAAASLWALLHWGVVLREERYMEAKFGDEYRELLSQTRRWL